jgi:hypothetical protein
MELPSTPCSEALASCGPGPCARDRNGAFMAPAGRVNAIKTGWPRGSLVPSSAPPWAVRGEAPFSHGIFVETMCFFGKSPIPDRARESIRSAKFERRQRRSAKAQIQGHVVDTLTNEPVTISQIVVCTFTRKADGEVILDGCRAARFAQPE